MVENIVEKGEDADNQHFLLFPQWFLPYQRTEAQFCHCHLEMFRIRKGLNFVVWERLLLSTTQSRLITTL